MDTPIAWSLDNAVKAFLSHGYSDGDLISHDWLALTLDLPQTATREAQFITMERIEQFKEALLVGHSVYIVSVRGQGYRIVPPSDQAFVAVAGAMREVRRQFTRCQKTLKHTRMDELTAEESKRHVDAQVKVAGLTAMVGRQKRDVFKLFDK